MKQAAEHLVNALEYGALTGAQVADVVRRYYARNASPETCRDVLRSARGVAKRRGCEIRCELKPLRYFLQRADFDDASPTKRGADEARARQYAEGTQV
jgi:hypothetical protein